MTIVPSSTFSLDPFSLSQLDQLESASVLAINKKQQQQKKILFYF